ncbi:aldose 1-epimerase family protein [Actinobacillus delphinicola]|uniref:Deoxyribose mutarotase n=1 Tax=Actinobacillus delphinicola TaxID=51161 RepID=A0A448TS10_9PAST|nr:aldose 1-epimerase family protein [Actinobacillus delphinicola]VEJ08824.1 Uncharacterised protein [Actinobacillus delphinicola]
MYRIPLYQTYFTEKKQILLQSDAFCVESFCYPDNIPALKISNSRGYLEILPFMGQMIWDANFDSISLKMKNMFKQPKRGNVIVDTYGCFAFHSGLLSSGCPAPEDTHPLHGEFPCAPMGTAWLEVTEQSIRLVSDYEYVQGFGYHYRAKPSITLKKNATAFTIGMDVTNLSAYKDMPLMYMCHLNYNYIDNGIMAQDIPNSAFCLRGSIPAHVKPTAEWRAFNSAIVAGEIDDQSLIYPHYYDPEIVYFADNLAKYGKNLTFTLTDPATKTTFFTQFSSKEFPHATRWILKNPDQQVAAFILPATSRPEGYLAAEKADTLSWLAPQQTRSFHVLTGIKEQS